MKKSWDGNWKIGNIEYMEYFLIANGTHWFTSSDHAMPWGNLIGNTRAFNPIPVEMVRGRGWGGGNNPSPTQTFGPVSKILLENTFPKFQKFFKTTSGDIGYLSNRPVKK